MTKEGRDFTGPRLVAAVAAAGAAALLYLGMADGGQAPATPEPAPQVYRQAVAPVAGGTSLRAADAVRIEDPAAGPRKVRVVVVPRPRARARAS